MFLPGDVVLAPAVSVAVSWDVGCGAVSDSSMVALMRLETTAATGNMTDAVGYGIIGWYVRSNRTVVQAAHHRAKVSDKFFASLFLFSMYISYFSPLN